MQKKVLLFGENQHLYPEALTLETPSINVKYLSPYRNLYNIDLFNNRMLTPTPHICLLLLLLAVV